MRFVLLAIMVSSVVAVAQPRPPRGAAGSGENPRQQGGTQSPAATAAAEKPGTVRGTVVGVSGEPLRKADVTLRVNRDPRNVGSGRMGAPSASGGTFTQTTDPTGAFLFSAVPPGTYSISVQRNGYVPHEGFRRTTGTPSGPASVQVRPGEETGGITIRLTPQAVVTGRVVDEDGDPVLHANVQVLRERWLSGRKQLLPQSADSTDDRGEYRIPALMPGRYYLTVSMNRPNDMARRQASAEGDMSYGTLFYPGTTDSQQAVPLQITSGQELRADLQLRKVSTYRIRGRVLDESGKPASNAGVMAMPAAGGFSGARAAGVARGSEGAFEIAGLQPGSYTLVVNGGGGPERRGRMSARLPVQVGNRDVEGVVLTLQPPIEVSGSVRVAAENVALGSPRVMVESLDPGFPFGSSGEMTMKDGAFTVRNIAPGRYRFSLANMPPGTYLKSVSVQGQDITQGAEISSTVGGIDILLGVDAPQVTGLVVDAENQPVQGASVVLVPEASKASNYWLYRSSASDNAGAFTLTNIPPGTYTLYALLGVEEGSWYDVETLRPFDGKGVTLKLAERASESVKITVAGR